ncbi:hypothetical protein [uncultured Tenacibaculum sp.]|uniref:hypothetical protein n=1 Tax=uncultured Tenacibaculum sp. TaxID=174713 RepID=UPI00261D123B|nr:hypothetical protein [uncultured Tenacibaculum sp.]
MKMKLKILLLISVIIISYKTKNSEVIISNTDKARILNEILSDTTDLKLIPYQRVFISDFNFLPQLPYMIEKEGEFETVSHLKYLSHYLKEKDTLFLKKQIEKNKTFNLKMLAKYNYQILNTSELLKEGVTHDSLSKIVHERMTPLERLHNESYFLIDKPIFNKKMNRVCFGIHRRSSGEDFVFEKINGKWKKINSSSTWTT